MHRGGESPGRRLTLCSDAAREASPRSAGTLPVETNLSGTQRGDEAVSPASFSFSSLTQSAAAWCRGSRLLSRSMAGCHHLEGLSYFAVALVASPHVVLERERGLSVTEAALYAAGEPKPVGLQDAQKPTCQNSMKGLHMGKYVFFKYWLHVVFNAYCDCPLQLEIWS